MDIVYKTYYRCSTQDAQIVGVFGVEEQMQWASISFDQSYKDGNPIPAPSWFSEVNFFPLGSVFWVMTPPNEENTAYTFSWNANDLGGNAIRYIVELVMLDYCSLDINTKCIDSDSVFITWLRKQGGWEKFAFVGKMTYSVTIPEGLTYKNADKVLRYSQRNNIYRGQLVTTGDIPDWALDIMESLKTSIQAYVLDYSNPVDVREIPILIQDGDFTKRKTGEKIFDVSVNFIYAQEINVQNG